MVICVTVMSSQVVQIFIHLTYNIFYNIPPQSKIIVNSLNNNYYICIVLGISDYRKWINLLTFYTSNVTEKHNLEQIPRLIHTILFK